jgi:hypothetical protein
MLPLAVLIALGGDPLRLEAESTKTLRLQLTAAPDARFCVENLAGTMRVVRGSGPAVVAVATVHAESEELAGLMRLEQVEGEGGEPCLRVRYPLDRYRTIRYPSGSATGSFLSLLFGGGSQIRYDGHKARVSSSDGVALYADVEVQLPGRAVQGRFSNPVGLLHAEGVEGELQFDTGSADITLERLRGNLSADTGSGDVHAADLEGRFECDTGSGDCELAGFSGREVVCDTGSGDILLSSVAAAALSVDAGSGDIRVERGRIESFEADTGSGDIRLQVEAAKLSRLTASTGSGDVALRLGPDASFEAWLDTGSGDIDSDYADAKEIRDDGELVGYRRGDGRTRIEVDTGSGDLTISP